MAARWEPGALAAVGGYMNDKLLGRRGRPSLSWRWPHRPLVWLLHGCAAVLACGLAALALLPVTGRQAMVVTSGSMEPAISAGDVVVLARVAPDEVRPGDVITFQGYGTSALTTHRVVSIRSLPTGLHYQTKGDVNDTADPNLASAKGLRGRVVVTVPAAGRAALLLQDRWVRLLLLGGPSLYWTIASVRDMTTSTKRASRTSTRRTAGWSSRRLAAVGGTAIVVGAAVALGSTSALYGHVLSLAENTFSTAATF